VQPDRFTKAVPGQKYLVRSLYFDSLDYQSYNEKLEGNFGRFKFRIRSYSQTRDQDAVIRVEIKVRQGARMEKYGAIVSTAVYDDFMQRYHWECEPDPVLIEFERNVHARILRPKVLIEYQREGFQTRERDGIRITFDHHVSSAQSRGLFPEYAFFRQHSPHQIVLEIKHRDQKPDWLKQIVQAHNLKMETNSKYYQGIELTQRDLVNHALRV
jgi:SPX domain protein involved in polyphosphate accumulation